MEQIVLGELTITVDIETADKLKQDPIYAGQYLQMLRTTLNPLPEQDSDSVSESSSNKENSDAYSNATKVWTSARMMSQQDVNAIRLFLELRKRYNTEFADKKTTKNTVWQKIADDLNKAGFFVGEGLEGREKCRQKFQSLQSRYIKYVDKCRQTGEGKVEKPPYFEELYDILGDKDKVEPVMIIDSIDSSTQSKVEAESCASISTGCNAGTSCNKDDIEDTPKVNRFKMIRRSVRPSKQQSVDKIVDMQKEETETRKQEFASLMEFLKKDSEQRHKDAQALIAAVKNKKRKRYEEDSDSE